MEYRKLGRFHIKRTLAKGGMGEVVRSVDDAGHPIALKTILHDFQEDKLFQDMFIREAELTFQLRHPNIVRAYRFDRLGNRLVLALEYLDGVSLKEILREVYSRKLQIPLVIAVAILSRVLSGLSYAHNKKNNAGEKLGIVHRDLNPANIFITYNGEVKILDFGISKATQVEVHQLTPNSELRGKICYLSPEQIDQKPVDHRSDVFSLGVLLWEILAGRPLFLKDSDSEAMEAIVQGEYEKLRNFRPQIPSELEAVIDKALQAKPAKRFQSCDEFKAALLEATQNYCMPGVGEKEIEVYTRTMLSKESEKKDPYFLASYAWLLTQSPELEKKGLALLTQISSQYPTIPHVQLNYAKAMISHGNRAEGLRLLRRLARVESMDREVHELLEWIGVRRPPMIQSLGRSNPINFFLGKIRHEILGPTDFQLQFNAA